MPPRRSRTTVQPIRTPQQNKNTRKRKQRHLDAFSIATADNPERTKVRQHRLGEAEDDEPQQKKQRMLDDEEEPDLPHSSEARRKQQKKVQKGEFEELDISGGSDSEGNEWRMGEVNDDEDSDLDSDEAFGESDEERFEGFVFRGSSSGRNEKSLNHKSKRGVKLSSGLSLDEEDMEEERGSDSEEQDDFGEEGVDLATMLDDDAGSAGEQERRSESGDSMEEPEKESGDGRHRANGSKDKPPIVAGGAEDSDSDALESDSSGDSASESESDQDSLSNTSIDDEGPDKLRQLQDVVASLPKAETVKSSSNDDDFPASSRPTTASMIASLKAMPNLDPSLRDSVKTLSRALESASNPTKPNSVVRTPLPKRQQDRLEREAAFAKAKETLNRWIDTVKHNRRADHLSFPLADPDAREAQGTRRLMPTSGTKPTTSLESTIQNILEESGLATRGGSGSADAQVAQQEGDQLAAKNQTVEEVEARRAELRKQRELMFREDKRAKRIKKIKSKAYRRVHRKERERAQEQEKNLLAAAGVDLSEDERERNDRRRAEERMGARHRESRWAKGVKDSGRAAWDGEARDAVQDMARRNEELRKRMDGERVREGDESGSEADSESGEDDSDADPAFQLREDLDRAAGKAEDNQPRSRLADMKFMQRADAARRKQNDEDVERMRKDLLRAEGDASLSESEHETNTGRRIFGSINDRPGVARQERKQIRNELEERLGSSDESDGEVTNEARPLVNAGPVTAMEPVSKAQNDQNRGKAKEQLVRTLKAKPFANGRTKHNEPNENQPPQDDDTSDASNDKPILSTKKQKDILPRNTEGWHTIQLPEDIEQASKPTDAEAEAEDPLIPSNLDLVRAAFGGDDDAEDAFEAEKASLASSEDERFDESTNALPGWGSWAGAGISRRDKKAAKAHKERIQAKLQAKQGKGDGVKLSDRRDAKLKNVIISEKRSKKNAKYLAPSLPHPFESRQQYERSLRLPIGPEWTTKETFQSATKPRVLVKQGVIRPMQKPLV